MCAHSSAKSLFILNVTSISSMVTCPLFLISLYNASSPVWYVSIVIWNGLFVFFLKSFRASGFDFADSDKCFDAKSRHPEPKWLELALGDLNFWDVTNCFFLFVGRKKTSTRIARATPSPMSREIFVFTKSAMIDDVAHVIAA